VREHWCLELGVSLELGIWSLELFQETHPANYEGLLRKFRWNTDVKIRAALDLPKRPRKGYLVTMMVKTRYRNWFASWLLAIVLLAGFAGMVEAAFPPVAAPFTLAWSSQSDPSVAGFAVYYSAAGSLTTNRVDVGMLEATTLYNLTAGIEYSFFAVAYTAEGIESLPSNVVSYQPPIISPIKISVLPDRSVHLIFRAVPGSVCRIERSPSVSPLGWQSIATRTADADGIVTFDDPNAGRGNFFYRAAQP
jgi:hypothetical protein